MPTAQERSHQKVIRRRRQLIGDRIRIQNRIKAELRYYGIELLNPTGKWSKVYLENLKRLRLQDRWQQESFNRLIEEYELQVDKQTALIKELSQTETYKDIV